jgi:hypothetical protein
MTAVRKSYVTPCHNALDKYPDIGLESLVQSICSGNRDFERLILRHAMSQRFPNSVQTPAADKAFPSSIMVHDSGIGCSLGAAFHASNARKPISRR